MDKKNKMQQSIQKQMYNTAINAGVLPISKTRAARLLALCYYYGDENFVFTEKLYSDTLTAAKIYGFGAGKIPDKEVAEKLRQFNSELKKTPKWVQELKREYHIK